MSSTFETHSPPTQKRSAQYLVFAAFLPFALTFVLQELQRTLGALFAPLQSHELGVTPVEHGIVLGLYALSFGLAQIPGGILLDRIGPKRVIAWAIFLSLLGSLVTFVSEGIYSFALSRILLGVAGGPCLMAAFKANSLWIPKHRLGLANGAVLALGTMGALLAARPSGFLIQTFLGEWRDLYLILAGVAIVCLFYLLLAAPSLPAARAAQEGWKSLLLHHRHFLRSRRFWAFAILAIFGQGILIGYWGVWVPLWFSQVMQWPAEDIPIAMEQFALAAGAGFLASGPLMTFADRRGIGGDTILAGLYGVMILTQLSIVLWPTQLPLLSWALFGFLSATSVGYYSLAVAAFPVELSGRINSFINFLVFVWAFMVQFGVGALLNLSAADMDPGSAYTRPFLVAIAIQLVGFLCYGWLKWPGAKDNVHAVKEG